MRKYLYILVILVLLTLVASGVATAQSSSELALGLSKDWGYAGFSNDIQGLFSMKIRNPPQGLMRVDFYIDDQKIGEDTQAPFSLQFNTDTYPLGMHTLKAAGYFADGKDIGSNTIQSNFVPASAATDFMKKLLFPILGLVVVIMGISVGLPLILNKGKLSQLPPGTQRNYGIGGGAICPKCGRPFPLRLWFINLGWNKIDRCPYCGKWVFVRPSSLSALRQAEAAELISAQPEQPIPEETEADKLHKELNDSKYQDF